MKQEDLLFLSKGTRDLIQNHTYEEILKDEKQKHSLQTIVAENRQIAIGARMTSRPITLSQFERQEGKTVAVGSSKRYSGKDIADIYVQSVKMHGKSYYPIAGDWINTGVSQLILFVKDSNLKKYIPYARFGISHFLTTMETEQFDCLTDITPFCFSTYKTVLEITNVETQNLPSDFIGNNSSLSIYDLAFKGPSANILMI